MSFDNKGTMAMTAGSKKQKWLEMDLVSYYDDGYLSVVILDYLTNSTILIHDCAYGCGLELTSPNSLFASSSGQLVTGCLKTLDF